MSVTSSIATAWHQRWVDEMVYAYADWREQCRLVQHAYERWSSASAHDQALAFAAYQAALDGEERASHVYAELVRRVGEIVAA